MAEERLVETSVSKKQAARRKSQFLASIPWVWLARAAKSPGKALHVALAIRHQSRLERRKTIALGNRFLKEMGVSKDAKRRALTSLEKEGLIRKEQRQGANPRVTIVESGDS